MLIQTDERSATLTPFGSLALNATTSASQNCGKSWTEIIRMALSQLSRLASSSSRPSKR